VGVQVGVHGEYAPGEWVVKRGKMVRDCDHTLPAPSLGTVEGLEKVWEATDGDGT